MAGEYDDIKTELDTFASKRGPAALISAKVKVVNADESTCEVEIDNGAVIDDVQLRSIVKSGDKVVVIPKEDSIVLIARINNSDEYFVVAVEEFEKILIGHGDLDIEVADKIKIEKGGDSLKSAFVKAIEATEVIVVMQGNNPDYIKLAQAKVTINNIMN